MQGDRKKKKGRVTTDGRKGESHGKDDAEQRKLKLELLVMAMTRKGQ
jgi:hypothetical protein